MRILHIIQRYYPARGGAEHHLGAISNYLAAAGHEVVVATTDALDFELFWEPSRRRLEERQGFHEGVRIVRFPVRHLPLPQLAYPAIRRLLWLLSKIRPVPIGLMNKLAGYTPWTPDLWRWLESCEEPFDLVAGMTIVFEPLIAAGQSLARRRNIPYVCYPLTHLGAGPRPAADALSRFYTMRHQIALVKASDLVIAQTPAEISFYEAQGLAANRQIAVGPGVEPDQVLGGNGRRFREQNGLSGPIVLMLGSMSFDKGTVHTVEAVRRLWAAGGSLELVLIGAVMAPFKSYLRKLPPADRARIRLLGPVDDTVKRDALAAATMLAMPSRTDSFGIVFLEAWLYALPVIGARTWGVMDLVQDGEDGVLVPFGDVAELSGAIRYLIDHPEAAAAMGERGRQKVYAQHTWEHKCQVVADAYRQLVER
jgi:glycosyltransferase involved in cell wall biosynthesis